MRLAVKQKHTVQLYRLKAAFSANKGDHPEKRFEGNVTWSPFPGETSKAKVSVMVVFVYE